MAEAPAPDSDAIPATVITGFLGSGKTTLLRALLTHPDMEETAVLINEFGEIGLDHLLVREISEDIVLLNAGCLCCSVRGDLIHALRDLFLKRVRNEIPEFQRIAIETTGLADPAPIIHTLMTDPLIGARYRLDGIVTTVDAALAPSQLDTHPEAVKQAAVADRIVLTKIDLVEDCLLTEVRHRLRRLNPAAPILTALHGDVPPDELLGTGLYDPRTKTADVTRWLNEEAYHADEPHMHGSHHDLNRHDDHIRAFCVTLDTPIPWDRFVVWTDLLLAAHGARLLRLKGILNVAGEERPVVVHGVQHVFHPPAALPGWPSADRRSRIVFITRDLGREAVEATLRASI